ncbi:MAG: cadherin-like beta sandwich domain-containing protein, partial [Clostridia bacterium]|nr:cadherin-like beta sandwich domain-containing protein [Clostridia bacterium]
IATDKADLDATDFSYGGSDDKDTVTQDITLPTTGANGTTISWSEKTDTGNNVVVSGDTVTVVRPSSGEGNQTVTLTATISKADGTSETKDIDVVIKAYTAAEEADIAIAADKAELDATDFSYYSGDDASHVTQNFSMPTIGAHGSSFSWVESIDDENNIEVTSGAATVVSRPSSDDGDQTVTLRVTISKVPGTSVTKDIQMIIKAYTEAEEALQEQMAADEAITLDKAALDNTDFMYYSGDDATHVTNNFSMPTIGANGSSFSWSEKIDTGNHVVVTSGGATVVTRPSSSEGDQEVTLRATISKENGTTQTKDIEIIVKAYTVAEEANAAITADKAALDATDFTYGGSDDKDNVTQDITLPTMGDNGTTISWAEKTDTGNNVVISGDTVAVTRPANAEGDKTITLTGTISKAGGTSETKDIEIVVKASSPTYSVTYDSNGATGGSAPIDGNDYEQGTNVTVLANTGNLVKAGYRFVGWNTQADGNGTDITAGNIYTIGLSNITFFAKWIANADLSCINLSSGVLTPNFDKEIIDYSARVAYNTSTITVAPTLDDLSASITVNGIPVSSGQSSDSISLVEGDNSISIVTTAIDNTTQKTYTLTITREANINPGVSTGDLGGSITDGSNPLADVLVRVMKGGTNGTQYGDTIMTNAQGEFTFSSLPYGTYSLVGTKGDGIITKAIIIQSPTTTQHLEMPAGKQKTVVEVGDDTASAAASNLDEMFTAADTAIIAGGGEVVLKLVIDQKDQSEIAADATLIQNALQIGRIVGAYFDINMLRTVTGSAGSDVNDELVQPPAGKKVLVTVDVPVALRNKASYQVIRVHGGTTAVLPATYNSILHTLTFEGDLFSVYSIVYTNSSSSG